MREGLWWWCECGAEGVEVAEMDGNIKGKAEGKKGERTAGGPIERVQLCTPTTPIRRASIKLCFTIFIIKLILNLLFTSSLSLLAIIIPGRGFEKVRWKSFIS
jgi:hypothetical protein